MYSCNHCEVSCQNRTRFNRHMRHHMTTDIKFLETQENVGVEPRLQETVGVEPRLQETKIEPNDEVFKEMPESEKPKLEMTKILTDFETSVNIAMDDKCDLPNELKKSEAEIQETHLEENFEEDFEDDEFIDDEDYLEDDELPPPKTETKTENSSIDINQILKKYSNVIGNTSEPKAELTGLKNNFNSEVIDKHVQDSVVTKVSNFPMKQENPPIETNTNIKKPEYIKAGIVGSNSNSDAMYKQVSAVKEEVTSFKQETVPVELKKQVKSKDFTCDVCMKQFASKKNLKNHYILHTGEKPCKCQQCGESFVRKAQLNRHMKSHTTS